jgi:hypothetical protein
MADNIKPVFIFCGAKGADTEWRQRAIAFGHTIDKSLPRDRDLETYRTQTEAVGRALGRTFPTGRASVDQLLMRNIKAAAKTKLIYAVGFLDEHNALVGGTAWACCAMIERADPTDRLYFFNQTNATWNQYVPTSHAFVIMTNAPPLPAPGEIWLGIGSRELIPAGTAAIRAIWT